MNSSADSFDWAHARAFIAAVQAGSLSAAARQLGTSQPTLSRQVAALAEALGVTLFERVGRTLQLTEAGSEIAEELKAMAAAADAAVLRASGQSQSIEGQIRITASEIYAAHLLPPILARLRDEAPGLVIEIVATNTVTDLRRREADVAIRNARPADPDLFAKKVADDVATLYASPAYLDQIGRPQTVEDLREANFIGLEDTERLLGGLLELGIPLTAENFQVSTESHLVHWACGQAGLGIVVGPVRIGDTDPLLERVLPDAPVIPFPVWVVAHQELRTSRRVRLVFDTLAEMLPALTTRP